VSIKSYMLGQKYKIFPEFYMMKDNEIQAYKDMVAHKNPNDISYRDWFWHHPTAYKLFYYGITIIAYIMFGGGFLLSLFKGWIIASIITFIMLGAAIRFNYKQSQVPYCEGNTFYREWMEDDLIA